jgi:putative membrane protein
MDKINRAVFLAGLAIAALQAPLALAEANEHKADGIVSDSEFLRRAMTAGDSEVRLGQIARQQATDSDVRLLADQLVADHGRSNSLIGSLARDRHVDLPADLPASQNMRVDDLSKRTGGDFDLDYLEGVRVDQEAMVGLFSTEANTGNDADVRRFATQHLPIMQAHLQRVVALQNALKAEKR